MRKAVILTVVFLLFVFCIATLAAQNGYDLFQKALAKERAEGNLEEAIALYQKVIEESKDESLAAKAQLRIGICYEKLGRQEAQKAYQKVIDNYPSQTEAVRLARQKLSRFVQAKSVMEKSAEGLKIVNIKADPMVDGCADISPDGRYLSFVDWWTGDLAVYDVQKEKKRRLTDKGSWKKSEEFALYSRWSPDGKKIVYDWWGNESLDLRIIGLDNPNPRILYRIPYDETGEGEYAQSLDWSPDGKRILALFWKKNGETQIVSISVEDGSIQTIKTLDRKKPTGGINNIRFSPDGRHIAYDLPASEESTEHDIFLLSIDGKIEIKLIEHPANDVFLGFLPDGKHLLFSSNRRGTWDLWTAAVGEGRELGVPEGIKSNMGHIFPLGITQEGSFFYTHLQSQRDIYSAEIDPETGEILTPPKKTIKYYEGTNDWPDYSPDGRYLAYMSRRNIRALRRTSGDAGNVLCIFSFETEKNEEVSTELDIRGPLHWSPGGRSILISGSYDDESWGLYTIDVQAGEVTPIVIDESVHPSCEWSLDGKSVFYVRNNKKENFCEVLAKNIESGEQKKLYHTNEAKRFSISRSPNGKWLAIFDNRGKQRGLRILPVTGGEPKELYTFKGGERVGNFLSHTWSADGRFVLLPHRPQLEGELDVDKREKLKWSLLCIPVEGGEPHKIDLGAFFIRFLSIHPDGRHIAFASAGFTGKPKGVWVMENFLPEEAKKNPDE